MPPTAGDFVEFVRRRDPARYVATLFAPKGRRDDLWALYALRCELAAVPGRVSEPGLGEIRLKWWSDALSELAVGGAAETPVLRVLKSPVVAGRLPVAPLVDLAAAFARDLYADPPPTGREMEGYFGETQSRIFHMAAALLAKDPDPPTADCAGHAGVAYGLTLRLAGLAADRHAGRTIIPADLLARHGLDRAGVYGVDQPAALAPVIDELATGARDHLDRARDHWSALPQPLRRAVLPAFLPLAMVAPLLTKIRAAAATLAREPVSLPPLGVVARVTLSALRRRPG